AVHPRSSPYVWSRTVLQRGFRSQTTRCHRRRDPFRYRSGGKHRDLHCTRDRNRGRCCSGRAYLSDRGRYPQAEATEGKIAGATEAWRPTGRLSSGVLGLRTTPKPARRLLRFPIMEKFLKILARMQAGRPVNKDDIRYFMEFTQTVD